VGFREGISTRELTVLIIITVVLLVGCGLKVSFWMQNYVMMMLLLTV
jgi:hypothetical protein